VDEDQLKVNLQQSQAQAAVLRQEVKSKEDQLKGKEQEIQALSRDVQNKSKEVCDLAIHLIATLVKLVLSNSQCDITFFQCVLR